MQSDIGSLLHKVAASLDKVSDQVLSERLGIGLSQFRILLFLLSNDGVRQNQIADNLGQTEASISRQIRVLQGKGLAVIRRHASTRRDKLVYLTRKGLLTAEKSVEILNDYHAPMFARLGQKEQEQLIRTLRTMQEYIKD